MQASDFPRIETLNRRWAMLSEMAMAAAGEAISGRFSADMRLGGVLFCIVADGEQS
jgi:hypothetical protein